MKLILFLALFAQTAAQPTTSRLQERTFQIPDVAAPIPYGISVPLVYNPSRPRPLVLVLHPGRGGNEMVYYGSWFMRQIVLPALRNLDAIMVAPDSPTGGWADPVAERAVMTLLQSVLKEYAIDRHRILVTGYSAGGRGTWFMSSRHADLFTAAIPMAAQAGDEPLDRLATIPTYVIHSRDDERVPFGPAEQRALELEKLGRDVRFEALQGPRHSEMGGYVDALRRAGRWISDRWAK